MDGKNYKPCDVSIRYDGALLAALSAPECRPALKAFLTEKFNSIADILEDHNVVVDMDTLSPVTYGVRATMPAGLQIDLAMTLEPLEFIVRSWNGPA